MLLQRNYCHTTRVLTKNQKKTCKERGIPPEVFQYEGRFFHRLEVPVAASASAPVDCTKMIEALQAYARDSMKPLATSKRLGVSKSSFYYALKWQKNNPGLEVIRDRGKVKLLTPDMETEVFHWVALSQRYNGGVDRETCCRVPYSLMASDPEHFEMVKEHHKVMGTAECCPAHLWFFRLKKRIPIYLCRHKVQEYAVGRAMVARGMVDSVYDVLQVVLTAAQDVIPAANIWNMDETFWFKRRPCESI
jgi:hypothetical protein